MQFLQQNSGSLLVLPVLLVACCLTAQEQPNRDFCSGLALGYCDMYDLQFSKAHEFFADWQRLHPQDPLGPVSDAAAYLFSEFDRLHILDADFFANDRNFKNQAQLTPDPDVKQRFESQLENGRRLINDRLSHNPHDTEALFANILVLALHGDYLALIEKRNLAGLKLLKQARVAAENLVSINGSYFDAYLAIGVENYLLSLHVAPVRWLLQWGGAQTDKNTGLKSLRITAEKGHYLQPYARLLLAVAALRDQDSDSARELLQGLARQFPNNRLYAAALGQIRLSK